MDSSSDKTDDKGFRRKHKKHKGKVKPLSPNANLNSVKQKRPSKRAEESISSKRQKKSLAVSEDDFIEFQYPSTNETHTSVQINKKAEKIRIAGDTEAVETRDEKENEGDAMEIEDVESELSSAASIKNHDESKGKVRANMTTTNVSISHYENREKSKGENEMDEAEFKTNDDESSSKVASTPDQIEEDKINNKKIQLTSKAHSLSSHDSARVNKERNWRLKPTIINLDNENNSESDKGSTCANVISGHSEDEYDSDDALSTENATTESQPVPPPSVECVICGYKAIGMRYGVISCEACAFFFRRIFLKPTKPTCNHNQDCMTYLKGRNKCAACRYDKCLSVGMVPTFVKDQTPTDNATIEPQPVSPPSTECVVCGDKADGIHCGVTSCSACGRFFNKTFQKPTKPTCNHNQDCTDLNSRNKCAACRYAKCLSVRMVPTFLKEQTSIYNATIEPPPVPPQSAECVVCGDKAIGMRCRVISCEACGRFFRRIFLKPTKPTCNHNQDCTDLSRRNKCAACRYDKCLSVGMVPTFVKDHTPIDNATIEPPPVPPPSTECVVCGDKAVGMRCRVISCEACGRFFNRTSQKPTKPTCNHNQDCTDLNSRNKCAACRYDKCLSVGMVPTFVKDQTSIDRDGQKKLRYKSKRVETFSSSSESEESDYTSNEGSDVDETNETHKFVKTTDKSTLKKQDNLENTKIGPKGGNEKPILQNVSRKRRIRENSLMFNKSSLVDEISHQEKRKRQEEAKLKITERAEKIKKEAKLMLASFKWNKSSLRKDKKNGVESELISVDSLENRDESKEKVRTKKSETVSQYENREKSKGENEMDEAEFKTNDDESSSKDASTLDQIEEDKINNKKIQLTSKAHSLSSHDSARVNKERNWRLKQNNINLDNENNSDEESADDHVVLSEGEYEIEFCNFDQSPALTKTSTEKQANMNSSTTAPSQLACKNNGTRQENSRAVDYVEFSSSEEEDETSDDDFEPNDSVQFSSSDGEDETSDSDFEPKHSGNSSRLQLTNANIYKVKKTNSEHTHEKSEERTEPRKTRLESEKQMTHRSSSELEASEYDNECSLGDNDTFQNKSSSERVKRASTNLIGIPKKVEKNIGTRQRVTYAEASMSNGIYKCEYKGCNAEYYKIRFFKKHIKETHMDLDPARRRYAFVSKRGFANTSIQSYLSIRKDIGIGLPELDQNEITENEENVRMLLKIYENEAKKPCSTYYGCFIVCIKPQFYKEGNGLLKIIKENKDHPEWEVGIFVDSSVSRGPCEYHVDTYLSVHSEVTKLALQGWKVFAMDVPFNSGAYHHQNKEDALFFQLGWKFTSIIRKYLPPNTQRDKIKFLNKSVQNKGCMRRMSKEEMIVAIKHAYDMEMPGDITNTVEGDWYEYDLVRLLGYNQSNRCMDGAYMEKSDKSEFDGSPSDESETNELINFLKEEVCRFILLDTHKMITEYDPQLVKRTVLLSKMVIFLGIMNSHNNTIKTSELIKFIWSTFPKYRNDLSLDTEVIVSKLKEWMEHAWFITSDLDENPFSDEKLHSWNKKHIDNMLHEVEKWRTKNERMIKAEMSNPDDFEKLMSGDLGLTSYSEEDDNNIPDLSYFESIGNEKQKIKRVNLSDIFDPICLITLAIINSPTKAMTKQEISNFIWSVFPNIDKKWKQLFHFHYGNQIWKTWLGLPQFSRHGEQSDDWYWTLNETIKRQTLLKLSIWKTTYQLYIKREMSNSNDFSKMMSGNLGLKTYTEEELLQLPKYDSNMNSEEMKQYMQTCFEKKAVKKAISEEIRRTNIALEKNNHDVIEPWQLISLTLINSPTESVSANEVLKFACANFPYMKEKYPRSTAQQNIHRWLENRRFKRVGDDIMKICRRDVTKWTWETTQKQTILEDIKKWKQINEPQIKSEMNNPDDFEKIFNGTLGIIEYNAEQLANLPTRVYPKRRRPEHTRKGNRPSKFK